MLIIPRRESQLDQETANRVLDLEVELVHKERIIQRYQNEDSEAGATTEVCTEASTSSSSEPDTVEKARLKERVKIAARSLRKRRAKLYNDRLRAAVDAGLSLGQKDCASNDKSGIEIVLQSRLERRRCLRHLGRAFKRGIATAIRTGEKKTSDSTSVTHEQSRY